MHLTLTATSEDKGARIDAWLASHADGLTRSAAARLLETGGVTVNGAAAAKNYRLAGDETIEVSRPEAEETAVEAQDIPLDVVYEDADVIVVNKPAGLVVHPAPGHPDGTLVNALLHHCGDSLSGIGGEKRPGIVHRIDRNTSGLIIAAKNDAAHLALSAQLSGTSEKEISYAHTSVVPARRRVSAMKPQSRLRSLGFILSRSFLCIKSGIV